MYNGPWPGRQNEVMARNFCTLTPMLTPEPKRDRWILASLLAFACCVFLPGLRWGLPSRAVDPFLFGNRTPWTGKQILALAPDWGDDASRGADVAAHPLLNRDQPIVVNQTDSQRAALVRRYRLYSDQPDEMITLRALAQMKPGKFQFDPKLYQYGGLWVYPIGALLKVASLFRLVQLTPDVTFYLDHPEAFGRLYVIMRLYSFAWSLVGVGVMFFLATRISSSNLIGAIAGICYTLLPTVINGAHEAKPHLAGAVLFLIAVDLGIRALESGKRRWVIATGVACGATASMVLSGWLAMGVLVMLGLRTHWNDKRAPLRGNRYGGCFVAVGAAVLTYAIFNPYVILHLLGDRALLRSNLGNSAAMYQAPASIDGVLHGLRLLMEGGSTVIFFGMWVIVFEAWRRKPIAWLLLAATVPGVCIFLMHATGKAGEYGRFALPFDVLFVLAAALGMSLLTRTIERAVMGAVLCLMLLPMGASYVLTYGRETFDRSTRLMVADQLAELSTSGAKTLAVDAEPAPYVLPPLDLFKWKIVLLPRGSAEEADADVRIDPVEATGTGSATVRYLSRPILLSTPISWAGKPFRIETRPDGASVAKGER